MTAVGIDVGKASLDVALEGRSACMKVANGAAGIRKRVRLLAGLDGARIVVEATGGYEEPLLEACCDAGLWVARAIPAKHATSPVRPTMEPRPMPSMPGCCA